MPTVTIKSENKDALDAICKIAHLMQMDAVQVDEEGNESYYWKGVRILIGKGEIDISKLSGSFPDLNMDPETFRKKAWERNKNI